MNKQTDDVNDYEIIVGVFQTVAECTDFYNLELNKAKEEFQNQVYSKSEYKWMRKYLIRQMHENLRLLGNRDKTSRDKEKEILDALKNNKSKDKQNTKSSKKEKDGKTEQPPALTQGQEVKEIEDSKVTVEDKEQSNEDKNTESQ